MRPDGGPTGLSCCLPAWIDPVAPTRPTYSRPVVVVPIRSFRDGKRRLTSLDADARVALVREWAETVVRAAHDLAVTVASNDGEVLAWARDHDLSTVEPDAPGLDAAAAAGRGVARRAGLRRVGIAHADLPRAVDLRPVFDVASDVVVVTDRVGDGTNVLVTPTDDRFDYSYGRGSCARHRAEAERLGWTFTLFDAPELSHDVDDADDLAALDDPIRSGER